MDKNQNNSVHMIASLPKRRRTLKNFCLILIVFLAAFFLGWRVMPIVWPEIKKAVVYPVFPGMKPDEPTPAPTQEPYVPESRTKTAFDAMISAGDSVIYYFYKDYCPWCRQLAPLIAALPTSIVLSNGNQSAVRLICLNKTDDESMQIIERYYETYNIPEEKRKVPSMSLRLSPVTHLPSASHGIPVPRCTRSALCRRLRGENVSDWNPRFHLHLSGKMS